MDNCTITPTYKEVNGEMVQTGYFLTSNKMPLHWVAIENVIKVYGDSGYTKEYRKVFDN
jgi:hypothetical protein